MKGYELQQKSKEELIDFAISLEQEVTAFKQKNTAFEQEIASLRYQLNQQLHHRFGKKSEKNSKGVADGQMELPFFDEALEPENIPEIEQAEESITVAAHSRKKTGRKLLPADLPRIQEVYDIAEHEKVCACGCSLTQIGQDTSEQLDIIPARIQVIEHIKLKYACKSCEQTIVTAKAPPLPIPRSIATAGTLAHVITAKFCDHLPLYRQEAIFQRMGVDVPRNTLSHWVIKTAALLGPLYKLMQHDINAYEVAYADETTIQVLNEPARTPESKSYMWAFIGGSPEKRSVLYHYQPSRAHTVIEDFLEDFKGYLHCDGYSGYDCFAKDHEVFLVGCWMHARRKFYDVAKTIKSGGLSHKAVALIDKLFKVERTLKALKLKGQQIVDYRHQHAKPLLEKFRAFVIDSQSKILPKSPLGQAFYYANSQWSKLTRYLDDYRLEIDNGLSERCIKPFVIGRKNFLFCQSVAGARAAEVLYSLIVTCKLHKIEPYHYLRYVLGKIPAAQTEQDLEVLLPFNIDTEAIKI